MNESYSKIRYYKLKEAGLCVQCGKCPIDTKLSTTKCTLCLNNGKQRTRKYRTNPKVIKEASTKQRENRKALQHEVILGYGGYRCKCCGETEPKFLELDHVNDDGAAHREMYTNVYLWAKKNNFPPSLQILCANCNQGKRRNNGVCPHKYYRRRISQNSDAQGLTPTFQRRLDEYIRKRGVTPNL